MYFYTNVKGLFSAKGDVIGTIFLSLCPIFPVAALSCNEPDRQAVLRNQRKRGAEDATGAGGWTRCPPAAAPPGRAHRCSVTGRLMTPSLAQALLSAHQPSVCKRGVRTLAQRAAYPTPPPPPWGPWQVEEQAGRGLREEFLSLPDPDTGTVVRS